MFSHFGSWSQTVLVVLLENLLLINKILVEVCVATELEEIFRASA